MWDSLHACASVSPVEKRSKETEEVEEESSQRYAVKRGTRCTGQLRTGFLSYVYRFVSTVQV